MTLIFSGNDYKYELEGVMKLFIHFVWCSGKPGGEI